MVAVISNNGIRLMPTTNYRARKLLKSGRAVVKNYKPIFTIMLLDRADGETQPIEYCCDTGYQHIGISIKSEKHEYVNSQYDLLSDETEKHNDCRKYRRTRRNRKTRYRKPRWNNRKGLMIKDGFAPSIRNKRDQHVMLCERYAKVIPVTDVTFELGNFDTQALKAIEEGKPLPQGTDYQHGEQYGYATLREAVFNRDGYTCQLCKRSAFRDKIILMIHHIGFWKHDRTNRMRNLLTVCNKCHIPKNHKPGGKLYGLEPKLGTFKGATFMTTVRWDMLKRLKALLPGTVINVTYGAATKLARKDLSVKKSHSNDAYCMGTLHPLWRTDFVHYKKCRRNNRILEKFYDAKYIDTRDGSKKSGAQLGCNRTKRSVPRSNPANLRVYHGTKVSVGKRSIRRKRYDIRPGDKIKLNGKWVIAVGTHNEGSRVIADGHSFNIKLITSVVHTGGWQQIS